VNPGMPTEVDEVRGHADGSQDGIEQVSSGADDRQHDPVVVGIRIGVQQMCLAGRRCDRRDEVGATTLGEVRHGLEEGFFVH